MIKAIKGRCKAGQLKKYGKAGFLLSIEEVLIDE